MLKTKGGFVYIMTNKHHTVLYTGVTSNLTARIQQHINGIPKGSLLPDTIAQSWFITVGFLTSLLQ